MTSPVSPPGVVFSAENKGGDYLAKLQQLASGLDSLFTTFNAQLLAGEVAEQSLAEITAIQGQIENSLAQAIALIGTAGDTATYAVQLQTARTINGKPFNGTANITINIADIPQLDAQLAKIKMFALAGI